MPITRSADPIVAVNGHLRAFKRSGSHGGVECVGKGGRKAL